MAVEASGRRGPLRFLFPRRATQNVLVVPDEEGTPDVTLLICAHYDAPRGGLVTRDGPRRLAARLRRRLRGHALGPRAWVALALAAVAVCAGLRVLDVEGSWLGFAQFVPTIALLVALAAAGDVAVSSISPGAGDNAAGVGVALALHAELTRNPPDALVPALLLYGAGEGGPPPCARTCAARSSSASASSCSSSARAAPARPPTRPRHPQLRAACARAAEALDGAARAPLRRSGAAAAARGRRLPAAWIGALDADGIAPRSRQPSDTLEHLDPAASEAVLDFALACVDALDAELAR